MVKALPMRKWIEIVVLHMQRKTVSFIQRALHISSTAVKHWVKDWESGGSLEEKPKPGRPTTATRAILDAARTFLLKPGFGGLANVARKLHNMGLTAKVLHRSTISRMLKTQRMKSEPAIVPRRGKPAPALTAYDMTRRVLVARLNLTRNWDRAMFTDRKRFYLWYPGSQVQLVQWVKKGQQFELLKANRPLCVNIYAGLTRFGTVKMVVVSGTSKHKSTFKTKAGKDAKNITAAEYESVLTKHLLPMADKLMRSNGVTSWVFQQDNDPAHSRADAVIRKYKRAHNTSITLLAGWPPHSPDLSPIENMWAHVQAEVNKAGCKTLPEFVKAIEQAIDGVHHSWCAAAFMGMRQRLEDKLSLGGGKTKH